MSELPLIPLAGASIILGVLALFTGLQRLFSLATLFWYGFGVIVLLVVGWWSLQMWSNAALHQGNYNDVRLISLSPWGRRGLVLGSFLATIALFLAWFATRYVTRSGLRAAILLCRTLSVGSAWLLLLEPAFELRQVAKEPNHVAIVIDESASMSIRDPGQEQSRAEIVHKMLSENMPALQTLLQERLLDWFGFGEKLTSGTAPTGNTKPTTSARQSQFVRTLRDLKERYATTDLAGVLWFTDGISTEEADPEWDEGMLEIAAQELGAPIHVMLARGSQRKDIAISRVFAEEFGFVRTNIKVEVVLSAVGMPAKQVAVELWGEQGLVAQTTVRTPSNEAATGKDGQVVATLSFAPSRVGRFAYRVKIPSLPGDSVPQNNQAQFVLRVIRDRIRVLHIAGRPAWDVRMLRSMFKQNANVDLISFYILRTLEDISNASNDELALIPFPTRELFLEHLGSFDLVVMQNFDYAPYEVAPYLENIRNYVETGGALVMIGGELSFAQGGYADTPIADLLPVKLQPYGDFHAEAVRPELSRVGLTHPITALRLSPGENAKFWQSLPPWQGFNQVAGLKSGAQALVVHPARNADGQKLPLLVAGTFGQGRTLALMTDSLWRWSYAQASDPDIARSYGKFWENSLGWLMDDPDLRNLRITSERARYREGEPVKIRVERLGADFAPQKGEVTLTLRVDDAEGTRDVTKLLPAPSVTTGDAPLSFEILSLPEGVYHLSGKTQIDGRLAQAEELFLVTSSNQEMTITSNSFEVADRLAAASSGSVLRLADGLPSSLALKPPRTVRVDESRDVDVLQHPIWLFLLVGGLCAEWFLRVRAGRL